MTRNWTHFWLAIAAMVVTCGAVTLAINGVEIGSLGEWVSGIGAFAAVVVALTIADRQRSDAQVAAKLRSVEDAERRRHLDAVALESAIQALQTGLDACYLFVRGASEYPGSIRATANLLMRMGRLDGSTSVLSGLTPQAASTVGTVSAIMDAKVGWAMAAQRVALFAETEFTPERTAILLNFEPAENALRNALLQKWRLDHRKPDGFVPTTDELARILEAMPTPKAGGDTAD